MPEGITPNMHDYSNTELKHDKKNEKIADAYQHIGGQNKIVVIFASAKSTQESADHLVSVMDAFNENWQKVDITHIVKSLQVRVNDSAMMNMISFIQQNYPFFLIPADYQRMLSLWTFITKVPFALLEEVTTSGSR